jgi:broad specificity phosphatase PhoE
MLNADPSRELLGYLVRHGELNISNKWDGWGSYVLSPEGRESAEKAGQWLAFERLGRIVSSDLPRATQTADIIMSECNVACPYIAFEPNIRAWAIGDFTGKEKTDERRAEFGFYRENPDVRENPDAKNKIDESWNEMRERVKVALQYLCSPYQGLPTVVITHNSVLKGLLDLDERGDLVTPGGIVGVYMDPKGDLQFVVLLGATDLDKSSGLESANCG